MCGRYTLRASPEAIARGLRVALESLAPLGPRYNIAPTQRILVLRAAADGEREAVLMRWGIPSAAGSLLVNARAETVARLPAFRDGFARRRCLIPADGFYEWQKSGARKQPYFIHRPGDELFAFAGIWQDGPAGPSAECVLITQSAGDSMRPIHDRQPVRLAPEAWDVWLAGQSDARSSESPAALQALLVPPAADDWVAVPVSNFVNRVANDSARCIAPVEPERQSELFCGDCRLCERAFQLANSSLTRSASEGRSACVPRLRVGLVLRPIAEVKSALTRARFPSAATALPLNPIPAARRRRSTSCPAGRKTAAVSESRPA